MDLSTGIVTATAIAGFALTLCVTIITLHDREIKKLKNKLIESLSRERRIKSRERQCRDALYAIYEWANWKQRYGENKANSPPAPSLPRRPYFDDKQGDEDDAELREEEERNEDD